MFLGCLGRTESYTMTENCQSSVAFLLDFAIYLSVWESLVCQPESLIKTGSFFLHKSRFHQSDCQIWMIVHKKQTWKCRLETIFKKKKTFFVFPLKSISVLIKKWWIQNIRSNLHFKFKRKIAEIGLAAFWAISV